MITCPDAIAKVKVIFKGATGKKYTKIVDMGSTRNGLLTIPSEDGRQDPFQWIRIEIRDYQYGLLLGWPTEVVIDDVTVVYMSHWAVQ